MKFRIPLILAMCLFGLKISYSQDENVTQKKQIKPFIAYEFGEAAFNKFQSLSGEIGLRFANNHMFRLTHMNVKLTEQHLSSGFAGAVDGEDVKGKLFGFEAFYDFPVFFKGLYISPSLGYYQNEYKHIVLNEKLNNNSATVGLGIGFRETDVFRVKGLYYMVSIPIRTAFDPIEKSKLGETTIKSSRIDNNIWFFVGYEF